MKFELSKNMLGKCLLTFILAQIANASLLKKMIDSASFDLGSLETEFVSDLGIRCGDSDLVCHEYINTIHRMNADPKFRETIPVVKVTHDADGNEIAKKRRRRSTGIPPCPQFNQEYFNTHHNVSRLSLSPWIWEENFDDEREPKTLLTATNLCTGCMSQRQDGTWYENVNLRSLPIRHRVAVKFPTTVDVRPIALGYRCGI